MRALIYFLLCINSSAKESGIKHQFVCIGNYKNVLVHINQFSPEESWIVNIPKGSRDIQQIDPDTLLISNEKGAAKYSLSNGNKLDWEVSRYKSIQSARQLPNGDTLLLSSTGSMITLDKEGKELNRLQIPYKKLDLRLLRIGLNNNWVIGAKKPKAIFEVSNQGKLIRRINLPGKGYTAQVLANGNYLSSTGDTCKVVEVKPDGSIIRFVGGKQEHPELKLDFNSGWQQLENQNIIMTNWLGHNKHNSAPHLVEFDSDNKLVWKWEDHNMVNQVTNLLVIK